MSKESISELSRGKRTCIAATLGMVLPSKEVSLNKIKGSLSLLRLSKYEIKYNS